MEFTYRAYRELVVLLKEGGYSFRDYHDYQESQRCVILRHDIDTRVDSALKMAKLEAKEGVKSTYFVLLTSGLYNAASKESLAGLREIQALGMEIGLHYDEKASICDPGVGTVDAIIKECQVLSELLGSPISTVSMHRPSPKTLEADLKIPGIENAYGKVFFQDFKYLSDSRHHWREPVLEIVRSKVYRRLHILTHAFWYHEEEKTLEDCIDSFIRSANQDRYRQMTENITDLTSILKEEDL